MTNTRANHLIKPWEDEMARLRWLERGIEGLAAALEREANTLALASEPGSNNEPRIKTLTETATAIRVLLDGAGPTEAGDLEWAAWLSGQLGYHLEEARRAALRSVAGPQPGDPDHVGERISADEAAAIDPPF